MLVLLLGISGYGVKSLHSTNTELKKDLSAMKAELVEVKETHLVELDTQRKDYRTLLSLRDTLHQEHIRALNREKELKERLKGLEDRIQEAPQEAQDEINQEVRSLLTCYEDLRKC